MLGAKTFKSTNIEKGLVDIKKKSYSRTVC